MAGEPSPREKAHESNTWSRRGARRSAHVRPSSRAGGGSCPGDQWQVSVFPLNWQSGDPIDPDGQNLLIQLAIDGFITEFGSVQAGVEAFGFTTFDEFYAGAADPFYNTADRNDDGVLCFKTFPPASNQPTYLANGVDNNSHS